MGLKQITRFTRVSRCKPRRYKSLRDRAARWFAGWLVVFGINHYVTAQAFAFAFSPQFSVIAQCQVNDAALPRRHWSELLRSPGLWDFVIRNFCSRAQLV